MVNLKGSAILESNFPPNFPLRLAQKDLRLALSLSETVHQPIPVIASANELYKVIINTNISNPTTTSSAQWAPILAIAIWQPFTKSCISEMTTQCTSRRKFQGFCPSNFRRNFDLTKIIVDTLPFDTSIYDYPLLSPFFLVPYFVASLSYWIYFVIFDDFK